VGAEHPVELVADDRMSEGRQVDADLMQTSGAWPGADEGVPRQPFQNLVMGSGRLRVHSLGAAGHQGPRVSPPDRQIDQSLVTGDNAVDEGNIAFRDPFPLKLDRQQAMRQMILGRGDDAAGVSIQPMDDAGFFLTGIVGLQIEIVLQGVRQRARGILARRVNDQPGRLVDDQQPLVFKHDAEGNVFGRHQVIRGLQKSDTDGFARKDALIRGRDDTIDLDLSCADQSMQSPGGITAQVPRQERVHTRSGQVAFDDCGGKMHDDSIRRPVHAAVAASSCSQMQSGAAWVCRARCGCCQPADQAG